MAYSPFFHTLYDQTAPAGTIGRGTHYSVLRAVAWHDVHLNPTAEAHFQDFAVIWDEDHDARVAQVAEGIYRAGLLGPVRFIGERKGMLAVLLDSETFETWDQLQVERYKERLTGAVRRSCEDFGDWWEVRVGDSTETSSIISDQDFLKVHTYLECIRMLWDLGIKEPPTLGSSAGERQLQSQS